MGLRKWKTKGQEDEISGPRAPGETFVSRKTMRKNAKQLKKLQAKAFAQRKPIDNIIKEAFNAKSKEQKKKEKRKAQRKRKREEKEQKRIEENDEDDDDDDEMNEDDESMDDEEQMEARKKKRRENQVLEVDVSRKKRKRGYSESSDSDDDITYEEYLRQVEEKKRQGLTNEEADQEDDAAIRRYGKLLGVKETKKDREGKMSIPKMMKNDGLDLLLEFCDTETRADLLANEKDGTIEDEDDDAEEDDKEVEDEEVEVDDLGDDLDLSEGSDDEDIDDEMTDEELEEEEGMSGEFSDEQEDTDKKGDNVSEDIYGRKINRNTGELIKFDPLAAKKKLEELEAKDDGVSAEQKAKVDRAVTGLINRLSDATLIKSKQAIAELWASQSKNDVKSALCKVLSRVLNSSFRLQDSLVATYALFLAMLHTSVSSEISAHFVEVFLVDFVATVTNDSEIDESDKSLVNRAVFVSMLVNFKIILPSIVLEIIDKMRTNLTVENLQLTTNLIQYAYKALKKSCWVTVTEKIDKATEEFASKPISSLPRANFAMEELEALKKNVPKTIDYSVIEHQVKVMQGLAKKDKSMSGEKELGMSLEDLLRAEERGRWWVVGSAFRLPEHLNHNDTLSNNKKTSANFPEEIVAMATKAGMNTEVRRNVFCSVACADDEDEAFEKLVRLSLKGEKEREIVHVLIAMMLKEKLYNPFYGAVLSRFCEYNKRFMITLQFALWDRLRESDSLKPRAIGHVGSLLHSLVSKEVLPITVLKAVEWATLSSSQKKILKKMFTQLAKTSEPILKRIFEPLISAEKRQKFEMLSEGLRVFLHMNFKDDPVYEKIDKLIVESGLL